MGQEGDWLVLLDVQVSKANYFTDYNLCYKKYSRNLHNLILNTIALQDRDVLKVDVDPNFKLSLHSHPSFRQDINLSKWQENICFVQQIALIDVK